MNRTAIEWTDFSANPLQYRDATQRVVWGCVHHSPGCVNCYAERLAKRYGRGGPFQAQVMKDLTPFLDKAELRQMLTYKPAAGKRCFVGDMTDIFGSWVPDDLLDRLFAVFALRQDVTWQILTKRAARMRAYMDIRTDNRGDLIGQQMREMSEGRHSGLFELPLENVWLGVSVEDQQRADERIPHLLQTPAVVRWLSCEPLLGPLTLERWLPIAARGDGYERARCEAAYGENRPRIGWAIAGGESGPGARPMQAEWARSIRDQCRAAGVPFFMKQGSQANWPEYKDFDSFPKELQVREYP